MLHRVEGAWVERTEEAELESRRVVLWPEWHTLGSWESRRGAEKAPWDPAAGAHTVSAALEGRPASQKVFGIWVALVLSFESSVQTLLCQNLIDTSARYHMVHIIDIHPLTDLQGNQWRRVTGPVITPIEQKRKRECRKRS